MTERLPTMREALGSVQIAQNKEIRQRHNISILK